MAKGIKVLIGNKELNLKGDDESLIIKSAELVNATLKELGYKSEQELDLTTLILASLNLAENCLLIKAQVQENHQVIIDEISSMTGYVEKNFN